MKLIKCIPAILIIFLFSFGCKNINLEKDLMFKVTKDGKLYVAEIKNETEGLKSYKKLSLPSKIRKDRRFRVITCFASDNKTLLLVTRQHGIWKSSDMGKNWSRYDTDLPREIIYPFKEKNITKIIRSFSVSKDRKTMLCLMPRLLLVSKNGGKSFEKLPLRGMGLFAEMLTAVLDPDKPKRMLIGTSTMGIYYSRDSGNRVKRIRKGSPGEPLNHPNFVEEVRSLVFDPGKKDIFYAGFANSVGVYRGSVSQRLLKPIDVTGLYNYPDGEFCSLDNLMMVDNVLYMSTSCEKNFKHGTKGNNSGKEWLNDQLKGNDLIVYQQAKGPVLTRRYHYPVERTFKPSDKCMGKRALYISYGFTQKDNYPKLLALLKKLRLNAVVINLKDDYGVLRVPTKDPKILQVPDVCKPYKNVTDTIKKLKKDGIYVIGRLVVFKDKRLYPFENYKYAVKYPSGAPLHKGPEKWVDIFSEFVWDYNIAMAKAIQSAGVDEIQFDYIRSPDLRGKRKGRERYDFQKPGQFKREALASFLKKAREELTVPTSMDSFGYDSIYQTNWIGQDVKTLSQYVDALSPMFYPSHYTGGYARSYKGKGKTIYYIILLSCKRVQELTNGVHVRPYIQAFYYKENWDGYGTDYIGWELDALKKAGLSDFIFWNDLSEYKILIRGLYKYYGILEGDNYKALYKQIPKKPNPRQFREMVEKPVTLEDQ